MKSALQTIPRESIRPDSDFSIVINLPRPTQELQHLSQGQTVQWAWDYNFSLKITAGVFESQTVTAVKQDDGLYLTVPPLSVVGPESNITICKYESVWNADTDPPPPPPPNVIIVDNSSLPCSELK